MDPTTSALLGALVGGVAAGFATVIATVIVNRRETTRRLRVDMYDAYLPAILRGLTAEPDIVPDAEGRTWGDLTRLAVLAGRADARRWSRLEESATAFQASKWAGVTEIFNDETGGYDLGTVSPEREAYVQALRAFAGDLEDHLLWLERGLRGSGRRVTGSRWRHLGGRPHASLNSPPQVW